MTEAWKKRLRDRVESSKGRTHPTSLSIVAATPPSGPPPVVLAFGKLQRGSTVPFARPTVSFGYPNPRSGRVSSTKREKTTVTPDTSILCLSYLCVQIQAFYTLAINSLRLLIPALSQTLLQRLESMVHVVPLRI